MISKDSMLQVLFDLHYPPLSKQLLRSMIEECEDQCERKDLIEKGNFTPFHEATTASGGCRNNSIDSARRKSKNKGKGKSSKKRRSSEFNDEEEQSKRQKTEDIPLAKKPITLLKPKPPRKKLAPIMDQMMDEDPYDTP